jgi:DNA-binding CsgD family transcriptional regulator
LSPQAWGQIAGTLGLSPRELDIARHIFSDQTEAAIALALSISAHTVRTHTERLYRKLHVRSRVELVVRIVDEFLRLTADSASTLSPICAHRSAGRCPFDD